MTVSLLTSGAMTPATGATAIVVGGGFGGTYAAKGLARHGIETTLVDANGFQTFQPMLYQAATGIISPSDIRFPLDDLSGVSVVASRAAAIDTTNARVTLADGRVLNADYLVLATGASVNFFGVSGAADYALPLYTSADAAAIKARIQTLVEARQKFSITVIGAGATGVEITGALSDILDYVLPRTFPTFRREHVDLQIVDHASEPLAHMSTAGQSYARRILTDAGVAFHLGREVVTVTPEQVTLDDGTALRSDLTIWAGGLRVTLPSLTPAPELTRGGRVVIDETLRIPGSDRTYCIGDAAAHADQPLPQLGSVAKQQGIAVAHSIRRHIKGEHPKSFAYRDLGDMAMVRHDAAVVEVGPHHQEVSGKMSYLMWLGLHTYLLPGDQHRLDAVRSWVHEQVTGKSQFLRD